MSTETYVYADVRHPAMDAPSFGSVLCPIITPFRNDGVDHASLARLARTLVDAGVDGIVVCGTTGEFASMTWKERRRAVETVIDAVGDRVSVIAGAAATSVADVAERVDAVTLLGADAALVPPPFFHGGGAIEPFYEGVLARSEGRIALYNIPSCTGTSLTPELAASVGTHDRVVGMKDSGGDLVRFVRFRESLPADVPLYQGWDVLVAASMAFGGAGAVAGLANVAPEVVVDVAAAGRAGAFAEASAITIEALLPRLDACGAAGYVPTLKATLAARGTIASAAVRPPHEPIDHTDWQVPAALQ